MATKKFKEIQEKDPELAKKLANEPRILEVNADIDRYAAVVAFNATEGGIELKKALRSDVAGAINTLLASYKTSDLPQLLALIALLEAKVDLLLALSHSSKNKEDAEAALDELLS